ncbi:hypothetical protein Cus16_2557 [Curtobacterium sp. ER1/6]|nr:hypothetical protein Cus16_2557 [Curtobacterium sp. ER1/6]
MPAGTGPPVRQVVASDVAPLDRRERERAQRDDPGGEDAEAGPAVQDDTLGLLRTGRLVRVQLTARLVGQEPRDVEQPLLVHQAGDELQHDREHEEHAEGDRDAAGARPHEQSDAEREQGDERHEHGRPEDRHEDRRVGEVGVHALVRLEQRHQRHPDPGRDRTDYEGGHGQDDRLGQDRTGAARVGGEGRPDLTGAVLARDDEHPEHGRHQDGEPDGRGAQHDDLAVRDLLGHLGTLGQTDDRCGEADDRREPDRQRDDDGVAPERGTDAAELDPLAADQSAGAEPDPAGHRGGRRGAHRVTSAWYSTSSFVRAMYASSRLAPIGVSSWSTAPVCAATVPICWASGPTTTKAPSSRGVIEIAADPTAVKSRSGCGVRTSVRAAPPWPLPATNSAIGASARTLPRPSTTTRSAVWAISLIRWLERNTVRPSDARCRASWRTHTTPSGSRPLTGSSRIRVFGSPSSAAAMPSRCPMPREKPPTRFLATDSSPVSSMTVCTRDFGMPCVAASESRWLKALRPEWTAFASSRAPTWRSGSRNER